MSEPDEDRLFERWCRRGDAEALALLFDATAPRLLRLAIHLVGDPCEAEDLVQATFLTAIERRASVDSTRPVTPWLTGVLAHKARQHRRRSGRAVDVARLAARAAEDPSAPLERRELDGELARALDALDEPYRSVLVLRLRHGLEPADVAHALGRDAGTVRVQLHRGLEQLRARLPERFFSALAAVPLAPRGLAAVREVVVGHAAAASAGAATSMVVGGLLVGKKLGIVAAALALVALGWLWRSSGAGRAPAQGSTAPPAMAEAALAAPEEDGSLPEPPAAEREPAPPAARTLRGRVVDAESGEPLAGAELRLFAPREATALEIARAQPELFEVQVNGRLRARTWGDWPRIVGETAAARFGRTPARALGRPLEGEAPLASVRSASDGTFALPFEGREAVVEVAHPGHSTRWRPVEDPSAELAIALWTEREVRGTVVGPDGKPVAEPLDLVLTASHYAGPPFGAPQAPPAPGGPRFVPYVPQVREGLGAWTVRTGSDGGFRVLVGATSVRIGVLTPGWARPHPLGFHEIGAEPLVVPVVPVPVFRFADARTGVPIERVRLIGRDQSIGYVRWGGEFDAPGGLLGLPGDMPMSPANGEPSLSFVAWSEGYQAASFLVSDLDSTGIVDVLLEPGSVASFEGVVLRAGAPLAGAEVALLGHDRLQWGVDQDFLADGATTRADGAFALSAPAGSYVLRAREDDGPFLETISPADRPSSMLTRAIAGREPYSVVVELPAPWTTIDLDAASTLEVEIVDSRGTPLVEHIVALAGDLGRQLSAHTDARGLARFPRIPAGHYRLHTPPATAGTSFSFGGGEQREVDVGVAAVERVQVMLEAVTGPCYGRVAMAGTRDYSSLRARHVGDRDWAAVASDGTLPLDLATSRYGIEVREVAGRTWHLDIPQELRDGHVFELEDGDGVYRGRLERADGSAWPGIGVHVVPWSGTADLGRVSTVTGADGAFEVAGLAPSTYRLLFTTRADDSAWSEWGNDLAGTRFLPRDPPSASGTFLAIRLAEPAETLHFAGVVERADGTPLADCRLSFECDVPLADGALQLGGRRTYAVADASGRFNLRVPHTPRIAVHVGGPAGAEGLLLTQELATDRDDDSLRLVVP